MMTDPNVAIRRGSALALGVLPYEILANRWRDVVLKLCRACAIEVHLLKVVIVVEVFHCWRSNECVRDITIYFLCTGQPGR